jgi:hypothetical protein
VRVIANLGPFGFRLLCNLYALTGSECLPVGNLIDSGCSDGALRRVDARRRRGL